MMIIGKGLQNAASTSSEDRRRYEEKKIQASNFFKARCLEHPTEKIDRPLEGILVLKRIDIQVSGRPLVGRISEGGGYTHPHYMFFLLGLSSLELEGDRNGNPSADGFTYFDLASRTYSVGEKSKASATVVFENIGDVEEEKFGIYGRRISVLDNLTNEVVATRTEFFGPGPCPSLRNTSADMSQFLAKAINPIGYGCRQKAKRSEPSKEMDSFSILMACDRAYWEAHAKPSL